MLSSPSFWARWKLEHAALAMEVTGFSPRPLAQRWAQSISPNSPKKPVLLYSQVAWDDVWQRPQEVAMGLARHRPIAFVSPLQLHQTAGSLNRRWKPERVMADDRLLVLSPRILSGEYRVGAIRALNRAILSRSLSRFFGRINSHFLTNTPFVFPAIGAVRPASISYDIIDDFCAFEWSPREGRKLEKRLLGRADFVVAGTNALQKKFASMIPDIDYWASGVAFDKLTTPASEPNCLRDLAGPRLLYVGTLNDRVDGELFKQVALDFPDASVVVVGPKRATFNDPGMPSNVHFVGLQPHDALPGFYQHCDVGIMPFANNAAALAINPVKTLEYLACGLPVVSTPIPDVCTYYRPHVTVAKPQNWKRAIEMALTNERLSKREDRVDFARGRSWGALVERFENKFSEFDGR